MEKDGTPSAMPSVLKGFAMIGQPLGADEFEKAFGYKMPDITLNDEEKRRAGLNKGLEPEIRQEEKQPAITTEQKPETSFGQKFMTLIQQGNTQQAEQQKDLPSPPLEIDIRGVGNSQQKENNTETNKNRAGDIRINDPYAAKTLEILKSPNEATNSAYIPNWIENRQEKHLSKHSN